MTVPVHPDLLTAMEADLAAIPDMAALSQGVFDAFLDARPHERSRFISVDAAVLRMTDETFVLLHGLASGADWAVGSAQHWVDLHRNYGPIANQLYADWTDLCLDALRRAPGCDWTRSAPGWTAAAAALNAIFHAANGAA